MERLLAIISVDAGTAGADEFRAAVVAGRFQQLHGADDVDIAVKNAQKIAAGHSFLIVLKDTFPIAVLNDLKKVEEICTIYCATANPVEVIIAKSDQGRGIMGVIDGGSSLGVENEQDIAERQELLRKLGYKS